VYIDKTKRSGRKCVRCKSPIPSGEYTIVRGSLTERNGNICILCLKNLLDIHNKKAENKKGWTFYADGIFSEQTCGICKGKIEKGSPAVITKFKWTTIKFGRAVQDINPTIKYMCMCCVKQVVECAEEEGMLETASMYRFEKLI